MNKLKIIAESIVVVVMLQYALPAWEPPIGIPEPLFGITESPVMYENQTYDFGNGPEPYHIGSDGPYTHYVDNKHPNATDSGNPFGSPDKPRLSPCSDLAAGSVVELHGGPYSAGSITLAGTSEKPIFIRGLNNNKATVNHTWYLTGTYCIIENLIWDLEDKNNRSLYIGYYSGTNECISVRNCEFRNMIPVPIESRQAVRILYHNDEPGFIQNIVIYNNSFHHFGELRSGGKADHVGVSIDKNVRDVWIVDNQFHHIGGDGIQIAADSWDSNAFIPHHVYIGRNYFHDNFENAVDLKKCQDIILSQNIAYNFGEGYSSYGGGSPFRYGGGEGSGPGGRERIWTLYNRVFQSASEDGAFLSYSVENIAEPYADEIYYIGNIVHGCHSASGGAAAFTCWNQNNIYFVNNFAYDCDFVGGFWVTDQPGESLTLYNNMFVESAGKIRGYLIIGTKVPGTSEFSNLFMKNNLFYDSAGPHRLSFYEWYEPRSRIEYIEYTIDDLKQEKPEKAEGILETDPLFVDPANGKFYLTTGSPAIDRGAIHPCYQTFKDIYGIDIYVDFEGHPISDGIRDIGAYEFDPARDVSSDPSYIHIPGTVRMQCVNNIFNPSKDESSVMYLEVNQETHVKIIIYNAQGREVMKVIDENKQPGFYMLPWDGKDSYGANMGSGIYLVHIEAGGYAETKKIVIIK